MKKGLIIGIIVVTACCSVAFGVHHEMRRTAQMRTALDSALVQNRNYVPFTSDSTLKEVTSHFDHPLRFYIDISDDAYNDQETRDKLRVCVMSLGDGGHSYYWTQNVGHISSDWIEIPPIDCSVCITQPGFKPKVFNIPE